MKGANDNGKGGNGKGGKGNTSSKNDATKPTKVNTKEKTNANVTPTKTPKLWLEGGQDKKEQHQQSTLRSMETCVNLYSR